MTLDSILRQALLARVYDVAVETPLEYAPMLSQRTGNHVWLKREDEQPVFSFKLRGAYNKIASLSAEALAGGVVAASAGNHAQGVALSARKLGARAVIVMPQTTPSIKVDAVRALGGEVVLHGDNYDEAYGHARCLAEQESLTFIHPYDDPEVVAGQATIGLEILKQHAGDLAAVFVAVGGGGLVSGVGAVLKSLRPEIKVIGVEPEDADAMTQSLEQGKRVTLPRVGRFADGVAVRTVGETTFEIARQVVDECIVVSNDEICGAIKEIFEDRRAILEPAGALAYAGLRKCAEARGLRDRHLVAIACGANINFDSLRHVSERAEIGERREAVLAVTIPERPGSFLEFCRTIGNRPVTEFNYRYADSAQAHIFVGIKVHEQREAESVVAALREKGYETIDLTDDEIAKVHLRHMVGGRAEGAAHERLFAFTFPERSGALLGFLEAMAQPWNISLFHYRNHGSDYGHVLCGVQVPPEDAAKFQAFLDRLGFDYSEQTDNPACRLFLR
ncbi:MAG TPA: threonine ammonia-lyase, biosynthetic [Fimbriimonas sp.]